MSQDARSAAAQRARLRELRRRKVLANSASRMTRVGGTAEDVPVAAPIPAPSPSPAPAPKVPLNQPSATRSSAPNADAFDPAIFEAMQKQFPDMGKQPPLLNGAFPAKVGSASGPLLKSSLPENVGTYVALSFGVVAAMSTFFWGELDLLLNGAFPSAAYVLVSLELFKLLSGSASASLFQQGALPIALSVGKAVAAALRQIGILVFAFVTVMVLQTKLATAGEALSDALQLGESFHPAWFAGAVVLFLLALLAIGFVAVERKRRNAVTARFVELSLLILRHQHQVADWAKGYRTTFEQEEATPYLSRAELRSRVIVQLARAEPTMDAAKVYDGCVEPLLLKRASVTRSQHDGQEVFQYSPPQADADESKVASAPQSVEEKRRARLAKAAERQAQSRAQ
eukprot:INCI7106.1.p1 GENE.INCI7106.1~~INCI7106.1.p1  ORF type:complete len:399 (+),score=73.52 INCI7106.1:341-1537(+)